MHQSPIRYMPGAADAGRELAQLRHVLGLVQQMAGADDAAALDDGARLSSAYYRAPPVVQKRFDTLSAETAAWAAAAIEALLEAEQPDVPQPAAAALAGELASALRQLGQIVGDEPEPVTEPVRLPSWLNGAE